jgi:glycosyltransferase involved in cell wall biosynthesis
MKLAFVHEYLNQYGGAERVLEVLGEQFPNAPIYTTLYDPRSTNGVFEGKEIRTSFLQKIPGAKRYHHAFSALMPLAVEQFDISGFDKAFSVAASFAKGIITKPHTEHICYCLTPPRFLWDDSQKFVNEFRYPGLIKSLSPLVLSYLRIWDQQASKRVDRFIAISEFVRARIRKYYGVDAEVVYPPVDVSKFEVSKTKDEYFLMVGRLVAYKKFDLAIKAFNALGWKLKIVGTGIEEKRLKALAGKNIEFLGKVEDERLGEIYGRAQALIFPQEEDFGIVPLEAMACGTPVIAYRGGGAVETIADEKTGIFFDEQEVGSLVEILKSFNQSSFDPIVCRAQAEIFDTQIFKDKISRFII